jgi:hypothetical protein
MHHRRTLAWVVAIVVGIALIPAAAASASNVGAASAKSEKKQNKRITRVARATAKVATAVSALTTKVTDQGAGLDALKTSVGGIDTRLKVIEGGVPQVFDALTKLADGLTQLKAGLETAGAGLTKLSSAYQAVEFGRAAVSVGDADLTVAAGSAGTSADIPDDGNAISLNDDAFVVAGAGATNETVDLRALIRSAESDGDDAAKTAGQAGGFVQIANADSGARAPCIGAPNPPGIFGTTPGATIVTPSGNRTDLPLKNIPGGNSRTSTVEPTGANGTSLLPAPCTFAAAPGATYRVHWSVQFLDIPTTTTPGPTE